jgi:tRNA dimethylallyltransferase
MDIGTAKPSEEERAEVPHHLLDVVEPNQSFSAAGFKRLANEAINDISTRGKLPILVGGTGLYVDAVLFDYEFSPSGSKRDMQNPRHLSKDVPRQKSELRPGTLIIGLEQDRETLRERIQSRVDTMVQTGFVDEVKKLGELYGWDAPALQAPGYKAFREYLNGTVSLEEAKALFVRNDMQLAKRQRTWFKRNKSIHWLNNRENAVDLVTTFLSK